MKSKYRPNGMGMRPHFELVGWKTPGAAVARLYQRRRRRSSLVRLDRQPRHHQQPHAAATAPYRPPATKPPSAKRPVNFTDYTLAVMGDVKPVTTEEFLNDWLDESSLGRPVKTNRGGRQCPPPFIPRGHDYANTHMGH